MKRDHTQSVVRVMSQVLSAGFLSNPKSVHFLHLHCPQPGLSHHPLLLRLCSSHLTGVLISSPHFYLYMTATATLSKTQTL